VDVFECLADATRRRLLAVLAQREHTAGELAAREPISRPAVSRHLRVMLDSGLIGVAADGRRRRYHLQAETLAVVEEYLATLRRPPLPESALEALDLEVRRASRDHRRSEYPQERAERPRSIDTEEIA
jgi:DNA-binding transcriptional ArsR family regulator